MGFHKKGDGFATAFDLCLVLQSAMNGLTDTPGGGTVGGRAATSAPAAIAEHFLGAFRSPSMAAAEKGADATAVLRSEAWNFSRFRFHSLPPSARQSSLALLRLFSASAAADLRVRGK